MKAKSRNLVLALGTLLASTSLYGQTTGFNKTTAGPHDYNDTNNWVGGTVNGIWHSTLALGAAQTATFNADTVLTSGWAFGYGGNFGLTLQSDSATPRAVTLGGDVSVTTGGGTSANVTIGNATNQLNVDLGGATRTMSVNTSRNLTFLNTISNGGITKEGAGTLTLSGSNIYAGTTTINAGNLSIAHNNALGTTAGNTVFSSGAGRLQLQRNITDDSIGINSAENITFFNSGNVINNSSQRSSTLSGNITLNNVADGIIFNTNNGGSQITFSGTITQLFSSQDLIFNVPTSGTQRITVNNAIANNGGRLVIGGRVTLGGVSGSGIGATLINAGANLTLAVSDALNTTATLTADGTFTLAGFDQTVNALNGASTGIVSNTVAGTRTLTVGNGGGSGTFGGTIVTGTGNIELVKTGTGTQTLTGANTYTGTTTVSQGSLVINGAVASTAVVVNGSLGGSGVMANATLSGSGSINPGNSPGIMTASATDPSGGLDYNIEMTAVNTLPTWDNATASVNDVLRLTGATPFTSNLDAVNGNVINVYFGNGVTPTSGDVFTGGFYTDNNADFLSAISSATFQYFVYNGVTGTLYNGNLYDLYSGPLVFNVSTVSQSADFDGVGPNPAINGFVTQFTVVPEPSAALLGSLGLLALLRRRR